jgi:hypothetical protein
MCWAQYHELPQVLEPRHDSSWLTATGAGFLIIKTLPSARRLR